MCMNFPRISTRRWTLLSVVLLALWQFLLAQAFARRAELAIQLLALVGTLLWTFPAGLAVGTLFHRRGHIAWIFPAALPFTATILYLAFTAAEILPSGNALDFNPTHSPGRFHVPIALTVCPFAAAGVAFGFLANPRPYAKPKRYRCINCNYDIRQSLPSGRCPECGHALIAGVDFPPFSAPTPPAPADPQPAVPPATPPADAGLAQKGASPPAAPIS